MDSRLFRSLVLGATALGAVACQDATGTSAADLSSSALNAALSSVPVGYGDLSTSYVGIPTSSAGTAGLWIAGGREASFDRGELMGGGLNDAFAGSIGFAGPRGNHGPFGGAFGGGLSCSGTFDAASGRVTCPSETRNGVTSLRSAKYTTAAGAVQQSFDTLTTNTVNVLSSVSGTMVYSRAADSASAGDRGSEHWGRGRGPGGRLLGDTATVLTASTTVASTSTRTVTGLAAGSAQRTISGASAGTENTTGTSTRGSFTATRSVGDTTSGLVVPVATSTTSYPTAGTVIRSIRASLTYAGAAAVSLVRREIITYNGTATAKIVITKDGVTQNCTRALPRGALTCS